MINDNYKPINKDNLEGIVTKLKEVLNPTQWTYSDETNRIYFKLSTDLSSLEDTAVIVNGTTDSNKVILFNGYISNSVQNNITGINYGSQLIKCLGYYYENGLLQIVIGIENPYNLEATSEFVRKLLVEVLISSDTKNHCTEIIALDAFPDVQECITTFAGETDNNWRFYISGNTSTRHDGPELIEITPGIDPDTIIDKIDLAYRADSADKLSSKIQLNVLSSSITGTGAEIVFTNPTNDNTYNADLNVEVDLSSVELNVKDYIVDNIPVAETTKVGGFKLYNGEPRVVGRYEIQLDLVDNYAYVDLSNFLPTSEDEKHRYTDMSEAPKVAGTIVQYIGPSDGTYTKGYFYQFTPTNFDVSTTNEKWQFITTSATTGQAIANYNINVDYQITSGQLQLDMVPENSSSWTISDDSIFIISQNSAELCRLTYAEIKELFKIEIKSAYESDSDNTLILNLTIPSNAEQWKQKNVLPMMKVGSPLVYKGTITSNQGETDIEALERQVNNPEVGDFYIVKPSNQEYCWIDGDGTTPHWEFMGDIFDPYEAGNGIDITSSHEISVKYDNDTIKKNSSGNLYVDGVLTDTTYSEGTNISISGQNNAISALGYTYDHTKHSFATGNGQATGEYSHAEGYVDSWPLTTLNVTASGKGAHAEGIAMNGDILASGDGAHAEGFAENILERASIIASGAGSHAEGCTSSRGILASNNASHAEGCDTTSTGFAAHAEGDYTIASGFAAHAEGCGQEDYSTITQTFSWNDNSTSLEASDNEFDLSVNDILYYPVNNKFTKITSINGTTITVSRSFGAQATDAVLEKVSSIAFGLYSHTEGLETSAKGIASHAEGIYTIALGDYSHAEGGNSLDIVPTTASGISSHAEGQGTQAVGNCSHTEGDHTSSKNLAEHAEGRLNKSHKANSTWGNAGNTLHSVGMGTSISDFKNAFEIMQNGDAYLYGVGNYLGSTIKASGNNIKTLLDVLTTIPAAQVLTDWNAVSGMGVILNKPALNFLPSAGGTLTGQVYYNESGTVTSTVTCARKYNWLEVSSATTLSITMPSSLAGPCEVIYAVKNTGSSDVVLTLPSTGHNMTGETSVTIGSDKIAEIVFTFWSTTEVSFNGGVEE